MPLHKINVISYGEDTPVAPNTTTPAVNTRARDVVEGSDGVQNGTALERILLDDAGMIATATTRNEVSPAGAPDVGSDWRRAAIAQHNMLLEGTPASIDAVLSTLAPHLREPVCWHPRGIPLALPVGDCSTLVLQNIGALDGPDQARLRVWLDTHTRRMQVVSATASPLFPLVECGAFDATLYYRLNVVRFSLSAQ